MISKYLILPLKKFQGKYRIGSTRLKNFDYGSNHAYFVTICTQNKKPYFGTIRKGIMGLSEIGCYAWKCWYAIPQHFPFVILDKFVVMPGHVHGILFIDKIHTPLLEAQNFTLLQDTGITNKFGPQSENLASIIRGFKIGVKKYAINFTWQSRFHDHVIRSKDELKRIRHYIKNNPKNWKKDKYQLS